MLSNPFSHQALSPSPLQGPRDHSLLLGWNDGISPIPSGFPRQAGRSQGDFEALTYDGDAPVLTCAGTGAGKGRGVLIPNLLRYPGLVIATDIKGELSEVTSRHRREMG